MIDRVLVSKKIMSCGFVIGSGAQRSGTHSSRKVLRCGLGSEKSDAGRLTRRVFLLGTGSLVLSRVLPSEARVLPKSREDLLSDLKSKKTEEEMEQEKADKAEERRKRLERQKELREAEEKKKLEGKTDAESDIESNLRANYYYPTARKRYLPRIKVTVDSLNNAPPLIAETITLRMLLQYDLHLNLQTNFRDFLFTWMQDCADEIENARKALETDDWAKLKVFLEGPADKATGPLKLYASSLAGQGLSLKV